MKMTKPQDAVEAKLECNESSLADNCKQRDKVDKLNIVGAQTNSNNDSDSAISLADASLSITSQSPPTSRSSYCSSKSASASASIDGDRDGDEASPKDPLVTPNDRDRASEQLTTAKSAPKQPAQWWPEQQQQQPYRPYAPESINTRARLPYQSNYFYQTAQHQRHHNTNNKSYHQHHHHYRHLQQQQQQQQQEQYFTNEPQTGGYQCYYAPPPPQAPPPPTYHQRFINKNQIASHAFYTSSCFQVPWNDASNSISCFVQDPIQRTIFASGQQVENAYGYIDAIPVLPFGQLYKNNYQTNNYYNYHNQNCDYYTNNPTYNVASWPISTTSKPTSKVSESSAVVVSPESLESKASSASSSDTKKTNTTDDDDDDDDDDWQDSCCSECQCQCSDAACQACTTFDSSSSTKNRGSSSDTGAEQPVEMVTPPTIESQPSEYLAVIPANPYQVSAMIPIASQHYPYAFRPLLGIGHYAPISPLAPPTQLQVHHHHNQQQQQQQVPCSWQYGPQISCQLGLQQGYLAGQSWFPETVFTGGAGGGPLRQELQAPLLSPLELYEPQDTICTKDTKQLTQSLVSFLPIESLQTQVCQAYGMDQVWQEEFEKLFYQLAPGVVFWHLIEVNSNPTISSTDHILAYRGHYIIDGCPTVKQHNLRVKQSQKDGQDEEEEAKGDATAERDGQSQRKSHNQESVTKSDESEPQVAANNNMADDEAQEQQTTITGLNETECDTNKTPDETESESRCHHVTVKVDDEIVCDPKALSVANRQQFPTKFRMFIDSAKVRFCCDECGHGWTSMKGRVVFWYELFEIVRDSDSEDRTNNSKPLCNTWPINPAAPNKIVGYCAYKLFGQQCDVCKIENRFERPMWYPEEVVKVLNNVHNKIGQIYFGFKMPAIDKQRRAGKPKTSHNSSLCQACTDGVCTSRK